MENTIKTDVDSCATAHTGKSKKPTFGELVKDFGPVINLLASIIQAVSRLV